MVERASRKPTAKRRATVPPKRLPQSRVQITDADRRSGGAISLGQEKQARDLLNRLQAAISVPHETRHRRGLILSPEDAWAVLHAAERYVAWIEEIRRDARAWTAAYTAPPSRRFAVYAKERGFPLPGLESNRKRSGAEVVATYLRLLGYDGPVPSGIGQSLWETTADAHHEMKSTPVPAPPLSPKQAIEVTRNVHRFASDSACRKFLWRTLNEIQRRRSGWRLDYPTDFPIPQLR